MSAGRPGPAITLPGAGLAMAVHLEIVVPPVVQGLLPFLPAVQAYVDADAWTIPRGPIAHCRGHDAHAAALVGVAEMARHADIFL